MSNEKAHDNHRMGVTMSQMSLRKIALLCPLLFIHGLACASSTYLFDIRHTNLESALQQFAEQTGLQVSYFTKIAEGRSAPAVSGSLTVEEALGTLLQASGLSFERIDQQTIAIYESRPARPNVAVVEEIATGHYRAPEALHLARAEGGRAEVAAASRQSDSSVRNSEKDVNLEEVIVIGSQIRGVVNDTAPLTVFDRAYLRRSGYSNMIQLVESLPMNFKGGDAGSSEAAPYGTAPFTGQNLTRGTGFNLRGLGAASTLTLINGRRLAPSAHGLFIDVSTIPLSAVERVEILSDGASAIYGADAVAGVVNIVLRKDFDGAESTLRFGATTDGSVDEQGVSHTFGRSWSSGHALLSAEYSRRSELDMGDRDYILEAGGLAPTWLLPRRKLASLVFNLDQDLPADFDLSTNILYSHEQVDTLDTIADGLIRQTQSPDTDQWSAAIGLGYEPFGSWRFTADVNLARANTDTDNIYTDNATEEQVLVIRDYRSRFDTGSLSLKADGSLADLPAGPMRLAIGGSYREDDVLATRVREIPPTGPEVRADDSRRVKSGFAELYVPIVGGKRELAWAKRIDLSLAARYDDYSDFGSTTNPKIGIVWTPVESLDLRATFSTSFRAPSVAEKALGSGPQQISTTTLNAPDGSGSEVPLFMLFGSAPLHAEESDNLAFGFTFRPASLDGAELSVNYFDIDYKNRIASPPVLADALSQRDVYGELILDLADDAAAQAYLDGLLAEGWDFIDWVGTGTAGVRHVFDWRQQNAARVQTRGFDLSATYPFSAGDNDFEMQLNAAHLKEMLTSLTETTTTVDQIDTYNQPLNWRLRGMVSWARGGLRTTLAVSHADKYLNNTVSPEVSIGSWTTMNLNVGYEFDGRARSTWLDGCRLSVNVQNLMDEEPPRATSVHNVGYDVFNADALGRFVTARFSKRW